MVDLAWKLWKDETGQDIAEYAVMLALILVIVVGTIRLIGSNATGLIHITQTSETFFTFAATKHIPLP